LPLQKNHDKAFLFLVWIDLVGAVHLNRVPTRIFAVSHNYTYNTDLVSTDVPYGTKGFIVMHKGGDGAVFKSGQATTVGWGNDCTKFQNTVGQLN
jgi:hypothetical protein